MPVQFDVPLSIPDAKAAALVAALKWKWYEQVGEDASAVTNAQLRANLKMRIENMLRNIYREHQERLAAQAADTSIDIT